MAAAHDTIILLNELQSKGFEDESFALLHHFREKGRMDTIASHRRYCEKTAGFADGSNNHKVQQRLALVLRSYVLGGFVSSTPGVFNALAEAAYADIP